MNFMSVMITSLKMCDQFMATLWEFRRCMGLQEFRKLRTTADCRRRPSLASTIWAWATTLRRSNPSTRSSSWTTSPRSTPATHSRSDFRGTAWQATSFNLPAAGATLPTTASIPMLSTSPEAITAWPICCLPPSPPRCRLQIIQFLATLAAWTPTTAPTMRPPTITGGIGEPISRTTGRSPKA